MGGRLPGRVVEVRGQTDAEQIAEWPVDGHHDTVAKAGVCRVCKDLLLGFVQRVIVPPERQVGVRGHADYGVDAVIPGGVVMVEPFRRESGHDQGIGGTVALRSRKCTADDVRKSEIAGDFPEQVLDLLPDLAAVVASKKETR